MVKGKKSGKLLTSSNTVQESDFIPLTSVAPQYFKISLEHSLENNFEFKDIKNGGLKQLHSFIEETVGKNLTITQVEDLFLRKRGLAKNLITRKINGVEREEVHLGKDKKPFRLFGYYSGDYFVLTKIDCNHETHK